MRSPTHSCRAHSHCVVCELPVACQNRWTLTRTTRACRSRVDASDCLDLLLPQSISVFAFDFSGSAPHPQTLKDTQSLPQAIPATCVCAVCNSFTHHPVPRTYKHSKTREGLRGGIASHISVCCMHQLHTHLPRRQFRLRSLGRRKGVANVLLTREVMQARVSRTAKRFRWAFTSKMISWPSSTTLGPGLVGGGMEREGAREGSRESCPHVGAWV